MVIKIPNYKQYAVRDNDEMLILVLLDISIELFGISRMLLHIPTISRDFKVLKKIQQIFIGSSNLFRNTSNSQHFYSGPS